MQHCTLTQSPILRFAARNKGNKCSVGLLTLAGYHLLGDLVWLLFELAVVAAAVVGCLVGVFWVT